MLDASVNDQPATGERELLGALACPPAVVLVEGKAGIGKSRLIQEMLDVPGVRGRRALATACPPFRNALTPASVVDALQQVGTDLAGLELSPLAGTLHPLFPEWAAELPAAPEPITDAGAARHHLPSCTKYRQNNGTRQH
ncbi:hypothetical protein [Streptomyces sp. NPDC002265]|uniref:hypothetical protein n=1 Tax=Streptomyces sp. NPDC002265 TaxID=3154415 RepID=UPI00333235D3